MRYFEPWDVLPRGGLYAAVRAIETRKPRQLEALISNGRVSAGAALPASMGGHSLLIVVVLEGATECLDVLLNDDACDPDATNTAGTYCIAAFWCLHAMLYGGMPLSFICA